MISSHHEFGGHTFKPKTSGDRSFGIIIGLILLALAANSYWHAGARWPYYAGFGAAFLLAGWLRPELLAPVNLFWTKLGLLLGRIVHPIVLSVLFFLVVTPVGVLARLMGKDLLDLNRDKSATTYWIVRDPPGPTAESMHQQF
jgi:hypothetical protein